MRNFYTATTLQHDHPELFYETLSHLTVLRSKLRDFQERDDTALMLPDLLRFIAMYEAAEQPLINTSPYAQAADSVQLMTVFKAKGLEYQHVFLPNCLDDVWGSSSRGNRNKLTLPANLRPIRHAGATDDERLRILFVAVTRAKAGLYLTSTSRSFSGKVTKRLKFLDEQLQDDGSFRSHVLPDASGQVISDDHEAPAAEMLALDWRTRHSDALNSIDMAGLLKDRLAEYQVSPTDILSFIDLEYGGPQKYFFDYILRFPRAPTLDSQFGTAIHETLEWCQHQTSEFGYAPMLADVLGHFEQRLRAKKLTEQRTLLELERGIDALTAFVDQRGSIFVPGAIVERSFRNEGVFCGGVHMSGRIDRIEIDPQHKTIAVVDYKTGKSYSDWKNDIKLHKNRLQLYLYKLLLEGSKTYREYTVTTGRIEFVEPDENGKIHQLTTTFDDKELQRTRDLVQAVWSQVRSLEFPDVAAYPATYKGVLQFEDDLILKGRSYTGLCL
jgi:DNA helicase-2/ATP-dependent DNA helicase PcrA